jgi:hypothetical protein
MPAWVINSWHYGDCRCAVSEGGGEENEERMSAPHIGEIESGKGAMR